MLATGLGRPPCSPADCRRFDSEETQTWVERRPGLLSTLALHGSVLPNRTVASGRTGLRQEPAAPTAEAGRLRLFLSNQQLGVEFGGCAIRAVSTTRSSLSQPLQKVIAYADCICHGRQRRIHRSDTDKETGVYDIKVIQFVRFTVDVEHRCWDPSRTGTSPPDAPLPQWESHSSNTPGLGMRWSGCIPRWFSIDLSFS
jgi:hypothetical protein